MAARAIARGAGSGSRGPSVCPGRAAMLRTFRAQLIISFFLVILITPLLFLLLFYPTYGRYVLARR